MLDWNRVLKEKWPTLAGDPAVENEVLEELSQHLEDVYRSALESGHSPSEARALALAELGDDSRTARRIRRLRQGVPASRLLAQPPASRFVGDGWLHLQAWWRDVVQSGRSLLRQPFFSLAAILILAVGIGASTAVFSIVYGVLFRPLPFQAQDRLALIRINAEGFEGIAALSAPEILDLREQAESLEEVAGLWSSGAALTDGDHPLQIRYAWVTANLFPMLGIDPILGRVFRPEEEQAGAKPVILLGEELWKNRYGADPNILGQSIELDDNLHTVVGVMPAGVRLPDGATDLELRFCDAWTPQNYWTGRAQHWLRVLARVKRGVEFSQAQQELDLIAARLEQAHSDYAGSGLGFTLHPLHGDLIRVARPAMRALMVGVALVLLISAVNVAGLLLTRYAARRNEVAVRLALGASRWMIVRRFVTENLILSSAGGVLGVLLAAWTLESLLALGGATLPRPQDIVLDRPVLIASMLGVLLTGLTLGLLTALQAARISVTGGLKGSHRGTLGPSGARLRHLLVVGEVALSLILLVGAGLMIRTFIELKRVDPGFRFERVLTFTASVAVNSHHSGSERWEFFQRMQRGIEALPGVDSCAGVSLVPLAGGLFTSNYAYDAETEAHWGHLGADYRTVTPGYFETLGIRPTSGRSFDWIDADQRRQAVIIDERLARQAWPQGEAVGRRLKIATNPSGNQQEVEWADVIGVVPHVRVNRLQEDGAPQIYRPFWLDNPTRLSFVVRTSTDPQALLAPIRDLAEELQAGRPVHSFRTLDGYLNDSLSSTRFVLSLMGLFAAIALVLAAVGLYGVVSYSVSQRRQELGVRMALGAGASSITRLVLGRGLVLVSIGVGAGLLGAVLLTRFLTGLLYGVTATDPMSYLAPVISLAVIGLLACLIPAWRAVKIDPVEALRSV